MNSREEIDLIIELAISKADLKFTDELSGIRETIAGFPGMVAKEIHACQAHQDKRRRWNVGTLISSVAALTALVVAVASHF